MNLPKDSSSKRVSLQTSARSSIKDDNLRGMKMSSAPSIPVRDLCRDLGFQQNVRSNDLVKLTHRWRKSYSFHDGTKGKDLTDWNSPRIQVRLDVLTQDFLERHGERLWSDPNGLLIYSRDWERIYQLLIRLFYKQNENQLHNEQWSVRKESRRISQAQTIFRESTDSDSDSDSDSSTDSLRSESSFEAEDSARSKIIVLKYRNSHQVQQSQVGTELVGSAETVSPGHPQNSPLPMRLGSLPPLGQHSEPSVLNAQETKVEAASEYQTNFAIANSPKRTQSQQYGFSSSKKPRILRANVSTGGGERFPSLSSVNGRRELGDHLYTSPVSSTSPKLPMETSSQQPDMFDEMQHQPIALGLPTSPRRSPAHSFSAEEYRDRDRRSTSQTQNQSLESRTTLSSSDRGSCKPEKPPVSHLEEAHRPALDKTPDPSTSHTFEVHYAFIKSRSPKLRKVYVDLEELECRTLQEICSMNDELTENRRSIYQVGFWLISDTAEHVSLVAAGNEEKYQKTRRLFDRLIQQQVRKGVQDFDLDIEVFTRDGQV